MVKMSALTRLAMSSLCALGIAAFASAEQVMHCDNVTFASDLEGNKIVTLPSFDLNGAGGPYILTGVTVEVRHSGSALLQVDNDDDFATIDTNARIIRTFTVEVPGLGAQFGTRTITSPTVQLQPDDGDDTSFDPNAPDGHDFASINYSNFLAGTYNPGVALYQSSGPDTVDFEVDVLTMVNDMQFNPSPTAQQQQAQNPLLDVEVCVTYEYETASPATIPTVSEWGLIILTLLTLTAATLTFGRRRGTQPV